MRVDFLDGCASRVESAVNRHLRYEGKLFAAQNLVFYFSLLLGIFGFSEFIRVGGCACSEGDEEDRGVQGSARIISACLVSTSFLFLVDCIAKKGKFDVVPSLPMTSAGTGRKYNIK